MDWSIGLRKCFLPTQTHYTTIYESWTSVPDR